jgi:beta-glucosidase
MSTRKLIIGLANVIAFSLLISSCNKSPENKLPSPVSSESGFIKTIHRYTFRDLNKNGKLDIYEDSRQPIELRIKDLLKQMTLLKTSATD